MWFNMCTKHVIIQGFLVGWLSLSNFGYCLNVDDICIDRNSSDIGRCKLITECPTVVKQLQNMDKPTTCGFEKNVPIVCCVNETYPSPETSTIETYSSPETSTIPTGDSADIYTTKTTTGKPMIPKPTNTYSTLSSRFGEEIGKKSKEKCDEFANYVYETAVSPILLMDNKKVIVDTCTMNKIQSDAVTRREMPHLALIGFNSSTGIAWKCGGSLISNDYILTSASCVFSQLFGYARVVRLGDASLLDDKKHRQYFDILEITKHPKYNASTRSNDIALIKLLQNVTLNSYVRPACLSTRIANEGQNVIAAGWGSISQDESINVDPYKEELMVVNENTCGNVRGQRIEDGPNKNMHFCAKPKTVHFCVGDLGGPATVYADQYCMYNIVGVTTSWQKCGVENIPAMYTSVSPYINWIEENVWT